jgi:hypothetical protein
MLGLLSRAHQQRTAATMTAHRRAKVPLIVDSACTTYNHRDRELELEASTASGTS